MSLRYGIPPVDPDRRICFNCQHFCVDVDPHSGWGSCSRTTASGLFMNHTKHGSYMAYHTAARYYNKRGCKIRFKAVADNE